MAAHRCVFLVSSTLLLLAMLLLEAAGGGRAAGVNRWESFIRMPENRDEPELGTAWAVLVAGSSGFDNYRHQADVCHAYQLLHKGGLKDENVVVFMYDDIATDPLNPRPGIIINSPGGDDVYAGVPKDYTGKNATVQNFYAVLLGNKSGVEGGSGKVVDSGPDDMIFVYYSDHGGPGVLGMPNWGTIFADEFVAVLKQKHASSSYKKMLVYIEACESGSIFDGLLHEDLNIYATTAANKTENSWATYCPGTDPPPPPEYLTCLGDLYSVAWMQDSEAHDLKEETGGQQYETVKERTSQNGTYIDGSHVMEYGDQSIKAEDLYLFQGSSPAPKIFPPRFPHLEAVDERDAELVFLWHRYKKSKDGSEKAEILKQLRETMMQRVRVDANIKLIGLLLLGPGKGVSGLTSVRAPGLPLVDDWGCLRAMIRLFEAHCGPLKEYGKKHTRAFANFCNNGIHAAAMEEACVAACSGHRSVQWNPSNESNQGYGA